MSLALWLIAKNLPLGHYERYQDEYRQSPSAGVFLPHAAEKKIHRIAGLIVNGLSQYKVADLIAKEWEGFHSRLRLDIRDICNTQTKSGNVSKGIAYLDKLLNGNLLRSQPTGPVTRELRVIGGQVVSVNRRVDPAVAGAERAHAAFVRPPNYHKMSPAEKKRVNQKMAADRRRDKKDFAE
ncbi:MAG: hypothetical protein A3J46_04220 [Candidatus Yanofskybacteria bacterium RIFCSPHIGHO2_02_FULL_41_11]|uniref:Uncharacterized protein n=1 Tax=Candidatus Yanofskybacteria bacterium RIFCSPHIGHO2_02_FULL_41_11 TaxID=1802675 RepID=A0A1F8FA77_9BACT|nr:MAG: hypothetical protein A3J46_04220 [Candidatus Yanofskybacteria bacterium RIFCSPHIGHO2_02_FULL_41_11]